ncbi:hypothetical protein OSH11_14075 [Kaistia dalseonensis]|uniref:MarR family transcriptional regulator n=1 Tax=Kaistia dalseonensis TaxID=410840 RepID=A0ABU0H800_9HYPH|nr:hypothetical protein [Kaistia dalseonensis]MCX5495836.1 hypothetical protein [Kaistia dalseonensis]MDQ0438437.1 hypothetical protein [Kaistia dalseonensis]
MPSQDLQLNPAQWALLRTMELGPIDLASLESDLQALVRLGLVERRETLWRATDAGRMLLAMRRSL